jgi:hypothetical protein
MHFYCHCSYDLIRTHSIAYKPSRTELLILDSVIILLQVRVHVAGRFTHTLTTATGSFGDDLIRMLTGTG